MKRTVCLTSALFMVTLLAILVLFPLFSHAHNLAGDIQPEGNSYTASVFVRGPVKDTYGKRVNLTLSLTELSGVTKLGSAIVMLPNLHGSNGFSGYRLNSAEGAASGGKKWEGSLVERNGQYYINLRARTADDYLGQNETVTISFSATTPSQGNTGAYEFKTRAWTDNSSRDSLSKDTQTGQPDNLNLMASGYSDPVVFVDLPIKTGTDSYYFSSDRAKGLTAELHAQGTGFQTLIFSSHDSVSFLTTLRFPALHTFTTTYYQPAEDGSWAAGVIAKDQTVDLLQGYTVGWKTYFHRVVSPGKKEAYSSLSAMLKAQAELKDRDLSGLSDSELRDLAHQEGISYYRTELTPKTEQVWFAGVALDPGAKGVLIKRINGSYGTTDYMFDQNDELWPARKGYNGPDHGFGFVQDGDGYRVERGIDYPGNYIDVEQVADASKGKVIRYIDLSSPYSNTLLMEDMSVNGSGKVDEILNSVNVKPGAFLDWPGSASFSDDWDLWFSPDQTSYSAAFDSPFFKTNDDGSKLIASNQPPEGSAADKASTSDPGQEEVLAASAVGDQTTNAQPGDSQVATAEEKAPEEHDYEGALEYATDISQGSNYTALLVLSTIAILILATSVTIAVILVKNR
jgi:hypothetical protein